MKMSGAFFSSLGVTNLFVEITKTVSFTNNPHRIGLFEMFKMNFFWKEKIGFDLQVDVDVGGFFQL